LPFGQFTREKFNLIGDRRVAVDNDSFPAIDAAAAAMDAVARLAQQFFFAHLNVHRVCLGDQFLEPGFLAVFRLWHIVNLAALSGVSPKAQIL